MVRRLSASLCATDRLPLPPAAGDSVKRGDSAAQRASASSTVTSAKVCRYLVFDIFIGVFLSLANEKNIVFEAQRYKKLSEYGKSFVILQKYLNYIQQK